MSNTRALLISPLTQTHSQLSVSHLTRGVGLKGVERRTWGSCYCEGFHCGGGGWVEGSGWGVEGGAVICVLQLSSPLPPYFLVLFRESGTWVLWFTKMMCMHARTHTHTCMHVRTHTCTNRNAHILSLSPSLFRARSNITTLLTGRITQSYSHSHSFSLSKSAG